MQRGLAGDYMAARVQPKCHLLHPKSVWILRSIYLLDPTENKSQVVEAEIIR